MKTKIDDFLLSNEHILWLPNSAKISEFILKLCTEIVEKLDMKKDYIGTIEAIKNPKLASEFVKLAKKSKPQHEQQLLQALLKNYGYETLKNHELFENYKISEDGSYLEHKSSKPQIFFKYQPVGPSHLLNMVINKYIAQKNIFYLSVKEEDISLMEVIARDVLSNAPRVLNFFKTQPKLHEMFLVFTAEIVEFIKPELQLNIIKQLANIIKGEFKILSSFSAILVDTKQYDEVIKLLESELSDTENNILKESEEIIFCRHNLGEAYYNTGNFQLAKDQYLRILKTEPNEKEVIFKLFNIYLMYQELVDAKQLVEKAPEDLKILMEMSIDWTKISKGNLNLINQNNLPDNSKDTFQCFQYIAEYRSNPPKSISDYERLKAELIKISDNIGENPVLLFTTALYTLQYELAAQFSEKIPKSQITPYIAKIKPLLNLEEEFLGKISVEELITEYNLLQKEAIETINQVSSCLIVNKKYDLALRKVEEVLKHDSQNHDAIEIGLAAARLANNQEEIEKYSNLLYKKHEERLADNQIEDLEELSEQYDDPKKIHEYYQLKKDGYLFNAIKKIIPNIYSSWNIHKEGKIISSEAKHLGKYKGLECYGKISKKLYIAKV